MYCIYKVCQDKKCTLAPSTPEHDDCDSTVKLHCYLCSRLPLPLKQISYIITFTFKYR